jgi:hypothetical protein
LIIESFAFQQLRRLLCLKYGKAAFLTQTAMKTLLQFIPTCRYGKRMKKIIRRDIPLAFQLQPLQNMRHTYLLTEIGMAQGAITIHCPLPLFLSRRRQFVIPAKAGIHFNKDEEVVMAARFVIPAKAGIHFKSSSLSLSVCHTLRRTIVNEAKAFLKSPSLCHTCKIS